MVRSAVALGVLLQTVALTACTNGTPVDPSAGREASTRWALAVHGGAGSIPRELPADRRDAALSGLKAALRAGADALAGGDSALDVVEAVVAALEDDPTFNAGRGAVFTADGGHELDAAIMNGRDRSCGAVASLTTVRNPIRAARLVMERSPYVFLTGLGAEEFARTAGLELVESSYFDTPLRREQLEAALAREQEPATTGTVGAVALDRRGDLAAATSTGGTTAKRWGRVGDVPVIGAGTFADNRSCAVSATGTGEQFIRHTAASSIASLVELGGLTLEEAAQRVVLGILRPGDGGVIAIAPDGTIALVYSTEGMYRGAADSGGRFDVRIWE